MMMLRFGVLWECTCAVAKAVMFFHDDDKKKAAGHYVVTCPIIEVIFSEVGDLLRCSLHYDMSGRSKGTAEVVFALQTDALAAIKRYNNVQLDGKPLKIELVGDNVITPIPVLVTTTTNLAKPKMSLEVFKKELVRGKGHGSGQELARGHSQGDTMSRSLLQKHLILTWTDIPP
ncbi:hypothetical protein BDE02_08G047000 [Populus trichocarpa]|nr:hypothetical protein BDE02_08G047000 [Populus trichocarpa]